MLGADVSQFVAKLALRKEERLWPRDTGSRALPLTEAQLGPPLGTQDFQFWMIGQRGIGASSRESGEDGLPLWRHIQAVEDEASGDVLCSRARLAPRPRQ